jgi:hypothetical protein
VVQRRRHEQVLCVYRVEVWADGYSREGDHYTFSVLIDLDEGEELPSDVLMLGKTPSNPSRFDVAVARFPKAAMRLPDGHGVAGDLQRVMLTVGSASKNPRDQRTRATSDCSQRFGRSSRATTAHRSLRGRPRY